MLPSFPKALLALADGTVFQGDSVGAAGITTGEVVFNTSMTGYQEILSDPSYCQQIVTLTYPHIGNVGTNVEDMESRRVYAAGLIVRDVPLIASNFRSHESLPEYLRQNKTIAIAGIDTRQLTRILRQGGAQNGCLIGLEPGQVIDDTVKAQAVERARNCPSMSGLDLAKEVSIERPYSWTEGSWKLRHGYSTPATTANLHVVAYDFGVKHNILRLIADRGCRVTVVPAQTSAKDVLALNPDGVFLSNGPGDPEPCRYAIEATQVLMERDIPIFGICLGHQILALASGARTLKMKFGHHGANHPVQDLDTKKVFITSQNHGFAVDPDSLPPYLRVTHLSLFDGSIQGLARTDKPAFCFQGHPEASPGPHDIQPLFDRFVSLMEKTRNA